MRGGTLTKHLGIEECRGLVLLKNRYPDYIVRYHDHLPTNGDPIAQWYVFLLSAKKKGKRNYENYLIRFLHAGKPKLDPTFVGTVGYEEARDIYDRMKWDLRNTQVPRAVQDARQGTILRHTREFIDTRLRPCDTVLGRWLRTIQRVSLYYANTPGKRFGYGARAHCYIELTGHAPTTLPTVYCRGMMYPRSENDIALTEERYFLTSEQMNNHDFHGSSSLVELFAVNNLLRIETPNVRLPIEAQTLTARTRPIELDGTIRTDT